jgi:hypothetical protein
MEGRIRGGHMKCTCAAVLLLMILFPNTSWGTERKNYIIFKGGTYTFTDSVRDATIDTGFDGELCIGRYLHPRVAVEIASGWMHDGVNKDYGNDIKGIPVTFTAKAVFPTGDLDLFAGGGGGIYFAKFHGKYKDMIIDARKNLFGVHGVAGAYYNFSSTFFAGVEGKYVLTQKGDFGILRTSLSGFGATVDLGYRF